MRVGKFLATLKRDSILVGHALIANMVRAHYLGLQPLELLGTEIPHTGLVRLCQGKETSFGDRSPEPS